MNPQHCFTWASSVWNMWIPWSSEGSETRVSTVVRRAQGTGVTSVWSPHKLAGLSWLNSFFYQPLSHNCWLHLLLSTVLKGSKPFHLWKKKVNFWKLFLKKTYFRFVWICFVLFSFVSSLMFLFQARDVALAHDRQASYHRATPPSLRRHLAKVQLVK